MEKGQFIMAAVASIAFLADIDPSIAAYGKRLSLGAQATTSVTHDTNVYRTQNNKIADSVMKFSPVVQAKLNVRKFVFDTNYKMDYGRFFTRVEENYMHHTLMTFASTNPDKNLILSPNYSYIVSQDVRGDTNTTTTTTSPPDTWVQRNYGLGMEYKIPSRRLHYDAAVGAGTLLYDNPALKQYDTESLSFGLTQRYEYSGKTGFNARVTYAQNKFLNPMLTSGKTQIIRYTMGAQWKSTGKTLSNIEFGTSSESFSPNISAYHGLLVKMNVSWRLRSYSTINFSMNRDFEAVPKAENRMFLNTTAAVSWEHKFRNRVTLNNQFATSVKQRSHADNDVFLTYDTGISYKLGSRILLASSMQLQAKNGTETSSYTAATFVVSLGLEI